MLAFVVTLNCGRRYTIKAQEMRFSYDGCLELLATPPATDTDPYPAKQAVGLFSSHQVSSVVAKEFLVSEEQVEVPHIVRNDQIPF
jgi:hypothetical protein